MLCAITLGPAYCEYKDAVFERKYSHCPVTIAHQFFFILKVHLINSTKLGVSMTTLLILLLFPLFFLCLKQQIERKIECLKIYTFSQRSKSYIEQINLVFTPSHSADSNSDSKPNGYTELYKNCFHCMTWTPIWSWTPNCYCTHFSNRQDQDSDSMSSNVKKQLTVGGVINTSHIEKISFIILGTI